MRRRKLRLKPEVAEKVLDARARWKARKVQVLIVEEVPEGFEEVTSLDKVEQVLGTLEVPTRVLVEGTRYVVGLRQRVPRNPRRGAP